MINPCLGTLIFGIVNVRNLSEKPQYQYMFDRLQLSCESEHRRIVTLIVFTVNVNRQTSLTHIRKFVHVIKSPHVLLIMKYGSGS